EEHLVSYAGVISPVDQFLPFLRRPIHRLDQGTREKSKLHEFEIKRFQLGTGDLALDRGRDRDTANGHDRLDFQWEVRFGERGSVNLDDCGAHPSERVSGE